MNNYQKGEEIPHSNYLPRCVLHCIGTPPLLLAFFPYVSFPILALLNPHHSVIFHLSQHKLTNSPAGIVVSNASQVLPKCIIRPPNPHSCMPARSEGAKGQTKQTTTVSSLRCYMRAEHRRLSLLLHRSNLFFDNNDLLPQYLPYKQYQFLIHLQN